MLYVQCFALHQGYSKCCCSLCSLVCDCYRFDHSPQVVRAELTSTTQHVGCRRGLGTLHIPNTLSAMLWEPCTLVASICWLLSHLHCTVDAGTLALRVMGWPRGTGGVGSYGQSHAEMFDACWALHQPTCTCTLAHGRCCPCRPPASEC
jgi:hypothetical protein